ncbi:MAG TPA: hypothetical protein PLQ21_04910, partial [Candidatus Kapabacteria bacterium]|nr:hypothetical protein [Candidatus Kapabacteria bacterium]
MKIIFISIAAFVLLLSCSEEKGSNPTQPKVAKNIWDTISVEVSDYIECRYIWGKEPFVIYDDSTYNYHEKYNKEKRSPFCDTIPYPTVDFSTHDVIWWNYQYDVFQERPIGILRKNDSLKKYEYISVLS